MIKYLDKYGNELRFANFIELQWNRKWNECGSFVLQMVAKDYNPEIKYIQNGGRPETGIVQKVVYENKPNGAFVTLSGFFIEKIADGGAHSRSQDADATGAEEVKNALGAPIWTSLSNPAQYPGGALPYNCYTRRISDDSVFPSKISYKIEELKPLGEALFDVLQSGAPSYSYFCRPVFAPKSTEKTYPLIGLEFVFKKGRDLSSEIYFGTAWNDVKNISYTLDESSEKPCYICVQKISETSEITDWNVFYSIEETLDKDGKAERRGKLLYKYGNNRPQNIGEYYPRKIIKTTIEDLELIPKNQNKIAALMKEQAKLDMLNNYKIENISVDVMQNRFLYLKDYDLGDTCSIVIDELKKTFVTRIVEIYEVHSKNQVEVQIVLGTLQKRKYKKVII